MMHQLSKPMTKEEYDKAFDILIDSCYLCRQLNSCGIDEDSLTCCDDGDGCRKLECVVQKALDALDMRWDNEIEGKDS